eukprot:TRINITY_DN3131_c1_g2_i1.p1 TRINITY_DN3131_c1_g2~~TRINITY_DN3131_c1_g2_i1.p1  ORF type:complete len:345 (-),score=110.82 TRINITY_DN3131_c1_g2_i1:312-1319(-)
MSDSGVYTFLRIKFVSGQTMIRVHKTATAEQIIEHICELKEITEPTNTFGLYELKPEGPVVLHKNATPCSLINRYQKNEAFLLFEKRYFMTPGEPIQCPSTRIFVYEQSRVDVVTSKYFCSEEDAVQLAALTVQVNFGDHRPDSHQVGLLSKKIADYVPVKLLENHTVQEWEEMILEKHKELVGVSNDEAKKQYLDICRSWPCYGCEFFPAKYQSDGDRSEGLPKDIYLAVSVNGIQVCNMQKEIEQTFIYDDIISWGTSPKTFVFSYGDSHASRRHSFSTKEGTTIALLVQGYVNLIILKLQGENNAVDDMVDDPDFGDEDPDNYEFIEETKDE